MSLTRIGWPLGATVPALVVAISTVLVALANWPVERYALWVESSAALHESVGPVAAVISLAGAWAGHEVARRDVLFRAASAGVRPRQLASLVLTVAACGLVGLMLGLLPRWWWTIRTATWGQPNLLDAAMTIAAIVSITVVSVVLGSVANRRAWCLVIAVAVAAAVWYAISMSPYFIALSPVWASTVSPA